MGEGEGEDQRKIDLRTDYSISLYIPNKTFLQIVNILNQFCKYIT